MNVYAPVGAGSLDERRCFVIVALKRVKAKIVS